MLNTFSAESFDQLNAIEDLKFFEHCNEEKKNKTICINKGYKTTEFIIQMVYKYIYLVTILRIEISQSIIKS